MGRGCRPQGGPVVDSDEKNTKRKKNPIEGVGAVVSPVERSKIVRDGKTALSSLQQDIPPEQQRRRRIFEAQQPGQSVTRDERLHLICTNEGKKPNTGCYSRFLVTVSICEGRMPCAAKRSGLNRYSAFCIQ